MMDWEDDEEDPPIGKAVFKLPLRFFPVDTRKWHYFGRNVSNPRILFSGSLNPNSGAFFKFQDVLDREEGDLEFDVANEGHNYFNDCRIFLRQRV